MFLNTLVYAIYGKSPHQIIMWVDWGGGLACYMAVEWIFSIIICDNEEVGLFFQNRLAFLIFY